MKTNATVTITAMNNKGDIAKIAHPVFRPFQPSSLETQTDDSRKQIQQKGRAGKCLNSL